MSLCVLEDPKYLREPLFVVDKLVEPAVASGVVANNGTVVITGDEEYLPVRCPACQVLFAVMLCVGVCGVVCRDGLVVGQVADADLQWAVAN